ncbi:hypothetical protein HPB48_017006 [Haemaphysalis longicornis]|uniref:Cadherin domain-containing protein n=1 Tax=Haemaphysalis longicornis TaxID=44386 RepID=A0A9J6G8H6_HAELO|nr:hypothetical protein HPB48_017006 [Haemaphysalis longicornis]
MDFFFFLLQCHITLDAPPSQDEYEARVLESTPPGQALLMLQTTRSAGDKGAIRFELMDDGSGDTAPFAVHASGELILVQSLDYETKRFYTMQVLATDGKHNDVTRVNVTVLDVNDNDPQFSQPRYSFVFNDPDAVHQGALVGQIHASDADVGESVQLAIDGPWARLFTINNRGEVCTRAPHRTVRFRSLLGTISVPCCNVAPSLFALFV